MAWWIQPLEIADESGNPTGRFRLTANSDEGGGGPFGDTSHDHASAEEAQECVRCDEYCSRISGFPPRKERQISEPTEAQIEPLTDAQIQAMWEEENVTTNPFCTNLKAWTRAVRAAERAHGISAALAAREE